MRTSTFQWLLKIIALPPLAAAAILAGACQSEPAHRSEPADQSKPAYSVTPGPARIPATVSQSQVQVTIDNFTFTPATVTIAAGTKVVWVNHDDVPHTVTANDKRFASKALDTDDQFSTVFTAPGTYSYFCAVHPHMTGQIIVK